MTINQIIEDSQTLKIEITEYVTKYFQILEVVQKENPRINYQEIDQTTRTRT